MNKAAVANFLVKANAFAPFRFLNRTKLLVLMYHRFSEKEEIGKTSRKTFERHLQYLTRHYKIISLSEAVTFLLEGANLPANSAVLTIDDGYEDFHQIAFPILKQFGVPSTIYLVTEFVAGNCWIWTDKARYVLRQTSDEVLDIEINGRKFDQNIGNAEARLRLAGSLNTELKKLSEKDRDAKLAEIGNVLKVPIPDGPVEGYRALSWDGARQMAAAGVEIGSHTATHPILTNVEDEWLEKELYDSRDAIEGELGSACIHFCYPNGNVSTRERRSVEAAKFESAVTTEIRLCENSEDRFLIPRIDAEPEMYRFIQATSGFDRLKA